MLFHKLFTTTFGIGYIKGGGTFAAIFTCICWYLAWHGNVPPLQLSLFVTLIITFAGVWSSGIVEKIWGKDPSKVVIDEVAGMCITLLFVPVVLKYIICGLVLFRFFDILKPLFIRKMEALPGGWGVMFDDVLAGVYSCILLNAIVWLHLF